ncbi:flagellar biosynthesis anti-sigma factor FlgM [Pullulanibacillus sp. KACC 23026]|uniref:flagellar biosynthesis anti-sigma factor FlgM n=1 Tax=Pullulanibacillus sp. KACC 23026 TaxID=3028315 RepID=UPI0023B1FF92|nr:flagellar biosynthesis anti-sigma factor FlgM [Pullulanibacillus sp. KACC 23026]WEG11249.1 flagellar biosynthesis anti-sigma factor FlgM [Pullulanibacillus sp. KACC 23026]
MRINDSNYGAYFYQNQQKQSNTTNKTKPTQSSASDVQISSRGRELSQAALSEQTQRKSRVDELKQQISNGTYQVDSRKIADKMINFWNGSSN